MNKSIQAIAGLVIGLVFLMPFAAAETTASSKASGEAEAKSVSVIDLRFRQIGGAFGDFFFNIKSKLTFGNEAKLELLKERNAELKARQQVWIDAKADALANFRSVNLTAKQKQRIASVFQEEHEAIIKDHAEDTAEMREIQLEAKGNAELEEKAATEAKASSSSKSKGRLGIGIFG